MLPRGHISSAYRNPDTAREHLCAFTGWMTDRDPTRRATRPLSRILGPGLAVGMAAIGAVAAVGYSVAPPPSAAVPSPAPPAPSVAAAGTEPARIGQRGAPGELGGVAPAVAPTLPRERPGTPGRADGVLPAGATVFDSRLPGVTRLEPDLLRALRRAATDAEVDGVTFTVDSGWRSRSYQEQLFREAVSQYGSAASAARWVAVPGTSTHESGTAVDLGPSAATAWLSRHGATYGLCQIYRNEPWHVELRPDAVDRGCPPMYADPTDDPRMRSEAATALQKGQ